MPTDCAAASTPRRSSAGMATPASSDAARNAALGSRPATASRAAAQAPAAVAFISSVRSRGVIGSGMSTDTVIGASLAPAPLLLLLLLLLLLHRRPTPRLARRKHLAKS